MPDKHHRPPHAVPRPALRRQLDAGVRGPVTMLVAPAGSGKTVLLAEWVESRPDLLIAWFDIRPEDADRVRVAQRVTAALAAQDKAFRELAEQVAASRSAFGPDIIDALTVAVEEYAGEVVLIFDDLHVLSDGALAADLWRLAARVPANAHLVLSSRADSAQRHSQLRLEHAMVELRQQQLALDLDETRALLERITGGEVAAATVEAVVRHTEGWPAGVQLAGLSLRSLTDEASLVDELAETDRLVLEYLTEEVLDAQPAPRLEALMALSVSDAFSVDLARVLTGRDDAAELLADLVRESMFLVPVRGELEWFRFHQLFRDLLRHRLHVSDPTAERRLLRQAAAWFRADGRTAAAIDCLLRAREWEDALTLILDRGREPYERGHIATLVGWLRRVPDDVRRAHLEAQLLYSVTLGMLGEAAAGEAVMRALLVDERLEGGARAFVHAYLAALVQFRMPPELALSEARRALEILDTAPEDSFPRVIGLGRPDLLRPLALVSAGRACLLLGRLEEARDWIVQGRDSPGGAYAPYRVHLLGSLALVEAFAGRLRRAAEVADAALDLATDAKLLAHPAPADAHLARALVAIQRGEAQAGALALEEGMRRAQSNRRTALAWIGFAAAQLIDHPTSEAATRTPDGTPPPLVARGLEALRLRRARHEGRPAANIEPQRVWSALASEEIAALLTRGQVADARARMSALPLPPPASQPAAATEVEICRAWILALEGRPTQSHAHLRNALAIAAPERLMHVFVRAGAPVMRLVEMLPPPADDFRSDVLRRVRRTALPHESVSLSDPLTARELELLAYLPTRLTNVELAQRCYVSINTVKTHLAHIYRKLGVTGRTAAVERAHELGLIAGAEPAVRAGIAPGG